VTVIQRRIVLSLLFFAVALLPARAQEADLTWKFKKDAKFYQEMKTETDQDMKVQGSTDVKQKQSQTFYFEWTPTEVDTAKNEVTLKQKIIGLVMSIEIGGSKINYDSREKQPGSNNPLNKFFEALNEAEFKLILDTKKMEVKSIAGQSEFVTKLTTANPQMKSLLDKILSEKALKDMAEPMFAALPGVKKKKGESWDRESTLDMGPIGSYKTKYTYTYDGADMKKNEIIKVKTDLTYKAPAGDAAGNLPFRIKSATLKSTDGGGDIVYDPQHGWVASQKMSLTLTGDLSIEIGQQTTDVKLEQKQSTTITTSEKNPLPETPTKKP
jgi:hypothetical protein